MRWPTALICVLVTACCKCETAPPATYGSSFDTGSTVFAQPSPMPASSVPNLAVASEAQQRRTFRTTDSAVGFDNVDFQTPAGTGSGLVRLC